MDHCTLARVLCDRPLIDLDASQSIGDALTLMREENIRAIPIYGERGHWMGAGENMDLCTEKKQYLGIIDILDIVIFLIDFVADKGSLFQFSDKNLENIRIIEVAGESNESKSLWTADPHKSLPFALEPMTKGVHRLLVPEYGSDRDVFHGNTAKGMRMCTQADVISFFLQMSQLDERLNQIMEKTLEELGLVQEETNVVSCRLHTPLVQALKTLAKLNISAMAVLDDLGVLVETLSVSDLRGISSKCGIPQLVRDFKDMTVGEFIIHSKETTTFKVGGSVSCGKKHKLGNIMVTTIMMGIHRIWVINSDFIPVGVVSMTDMISIVLKEYYQ